MGWRTVAREDTSPRHTALDARRSRWSMFGVVATAFRQVSTPVAREAHRSGAVMTTVFRWVSLFETQEVSRVAVMAAVCTLALLASPTLAHEGESHGGPAVSSVVRDAQHVLAATGDVFEVVLKHPEHSDTPKTLVRIWVAETETNAPVSGAQVELTLTGGTVQKLSPRMLSAGVYEAEALLEPETEWAAVVTVTRGNDVDVLALGTVHLEEDHDTSSATGATGSWRWGAVGGASLLAVIGAWWSSRRKKVRS